VRQVLGLGPGIPCLSGVSLASTLLLLDLHLVEQGVEPLEVALRDLPVALQPWVASALLQDLFAVNPLEAPSVA
jgi:hypothetical protein